jgi:hypothetical protein
MTKTFITVISQRFAIAGLSVMMPLSTTVYVTFVLNFIHWDFFEIWLLVLGIFVNKQFSQNQSTNCFYDGDMPVAVAVRWIFCQASQVL